MIFARRLKNKEKDNKTLEKQYEELRFHQNKAREMFDKLKLGDKYFKIILKIGEDSEKKTERFIKQHGQKHTMNNRRS